MVVYEFNSSTALFKDMYNVAGFEVDDFKWTFLCDSTHWTEKLY